MPLSKQDQEFYESKLSLGSYGYLVLIMIVTGAVGAPLLFYIQDATSGQAARWTFSIAFDWCMIGCMLGAVFSFVLYLGLKFLLQVGWLPSRH